jgi:hypothetical protein
MPWNMSKSRSGLEQYATVSGHAAVPGSVCCAAETPPLPNHLTPMHRSFAIRLQAMAVAPAVAPADGSSAPVPQNPP